MHTATALAVSTGLLGFLQRPAVVPPPLCVCRCVGPDAEGEPLQPQDFSLALPLPQVRSLFWVGVGVLITLIALRCWYSVVQSLRVAVQGEELRVRRPRALAP